MQASALRPSIDALWKDAARLAGLDIGKVSSAGWELLTPPLSGAQIRGGFSELNNDGSPVQLCLSQSHEGSGLRMLVDPAWFLGDARARFVASRHAMATALRSGGATDLTFACDALLSVLSLGDGQSLSTYPSSLLWLGMGVGQPGCAVYVDVRPLGQAVWQRSGQWLRRVLPDAALAIATLERLRPHASLSSVGLEGVSRDRARAKVYWRLREPCALSTLGLPLLGSPRLAMFLATAIGERDLPLPGLVMSAGFDLASGTVEDAKIDLCGHCLPQSTESWLKVIDKASGVLDVRPPEVRDVLGDGRCEVAFLGAGLDRHGRHRLNLYLKPPGLPLDKADPHTLRERMALGCTYLCGLQQGDGSFIDYGLPVGASTQWVTALVGLALAEAARAADLASAHAAAERAAEWLTRDRSYAAGWGFNEATGPDADSTGFAIRLLRATGRSVPAADAQHLLQHWQADGGFATYDGPLAWGHAHPCVTAAAYLALDGRSQQRLLAELLDYSARTAREDGTWPSYWWRTHFYSTWHHLRLLRHLGYRPGAPRPTAAREATDPAGAFDLSYAAGVAHFREPGSAHATRLLLTLLESQRVDGGWTGGFNLRVTDPACATPWERPAGALYRDRASSVTTASVLFVLGEILRG